MARRLRCLLGALLLALAPLPASAIAITIGGVITDSPDPSLIGLPFQAVARFSASAPVSFSGDARRVSRAPEGGTLSISLASFAATGDLGFGFGAGSVSFGVTPYRPNPLIFGGSILLTPLAGEAPLGSGASLSALSRRLAEGCCGGEARFPLTGVGRGSAIGSVLSITVVPEPARFVPLLTIVGGVLRRRARP